jgi:carboxynorspermidine decarboxylase
MTLQEKLKNIPTPSYVVDMATLKESMQRVAWIRKEAGCKVVLATKAFSLPAVFPMMSQYLDGTTASGLFEARMGREEFGKEVHVYIPAYKDNEFDELVDLADDLYFNSPSQVAKFLPRVKAKGKKVGLRINPGYSNAATGGDLYNPCAPCSRFGTLPEDFDKIPWDDIHILHAHVLCDSLHEGSVKLIETIADKFADTVKRVKVVNFGGGHNFGMADYDLDVLIAALKKFKAKFPHIEMMLEPGGALVQDCGYLVTSVLDFHFNKKQLAILDTSANNHLPIILQAHFRQPLLDAGEPGEFAHDYVFGGNMCMTGDVIGEYSFKEPLKIGDKLIFGDGIQYSFVQNNTFNGVPLPDIYLLHEDGRTQRVSDFGYDDFRGRLGFTAKQMDKKNVSAA